MTTTNMHRKDFKPCAICHKGVMHTGLPLFWRVHIERIGVDMQAAQRQHGLEQFFGGTSPGAVALADVFSDGAPSANRWTKAKPCWSAKPARWLICRLPSLQKGARDAPNR